MPAVRGAIVTSTEIWDIVSNSPVITPQMRLFPQEPRVGSPTAFFIHPLWALQRTRITDYGDLGNPASDRRKWVNTNNLFAKLLWTRYPCPLKVRSVLSAHAKERTATLNRTGPKMSSWNSPVIPRYLSCERLRCSESEGSYSMEPNVPYVYLTGRPTTKWSR